MLVLPQYELMQCFAVSLISVLFVTWFELRPVGIFFILILCYFLYKTRCNICLAIPPEFQRNCVLWSNRLRAWRINRPGMFCAASTCCLAALAVLGHLISGTTIVLSGLILAAIVSSKYNFKVIKIETKDYDWASQLNTECDDEFLPEENDSNMFVLERACDLTTLSLPVDDLDNDDEEKSDEIPSDLMLPDNSLAEINDDNSSTNEDVEELLPLIPFVKQKSAVIEFKRGHFKRDSSLSTTSSSSEESLSKGLQFPDLTQVDGAKSKRSIAMEVDHNNIDKDLTPKSASQATLFEKGAKLLPGLVTGLVQWSQASGIVIGDSHDLRTSSSADAVVDSNTSNALTKGAKVNHSSKEIKTGVNQQSQQRHLITALDSSEDSDFEILEEEDYASI